MPDMDMNENEVNQGVSIDTLLQVIGLRDVEGFVRDQGIKKMQEQALEIVKQNSVLKSENDVLKKRIGEPVPPPVESPELLRLQKVNDAGDLRVKQLETQVHAVALERDAARKQTQEVEEQLRVAQTRLMDLETKIAADAVITNPEPIVKKPKVKRT